MLNADGDALKGGGDAADVLNGDGKTLKSDEGVK